MQVVNNRILPADLYEWATESLKNGELSQENEDQMLKKLTSIDWIKQKFETLSKKDLTLLYHELVYAIETETTPIDLMAMSRMYYNFCAMQIDTSRLRDLLNTSEYVRKSIQAILK